MKDYKIFRSASRYLLKRQGILGLGIFASASHSAAKAAHHAGGGVQEAGRVLAVEHVPVGLHQRAHEQRVERVHGDVRRVRRRVPRPEVVRGARQRCVRQPAPPSSALQLRS